MAAAIFKLAVQAVVNYFVDKRAQMKAHRQALKYWRLNGYQQKVDVEYVGATEPRRRLYGFFRAGGLNCMPAVVTGPTGTRLHKLMAISDGEIESVDAVIFDGERIAAADFVGGPITSGTYAGKAQIFPHLGLASQAADSAAVQAPGWTTEHRLDGVAYVYTFFDFYPDTYHGAPPDELVEGQGALVYDPRLDTSPGANPTSDTYKAFSTNSALILADFLQWGGAELPANILWSDVVTAANVCEETVTIPAVPSGTTTQDRYTCSIECYSPQTLRERDETILMLARAMMGACWYAGGKWHMRAGAYTSPVGTISDSDFVGDSFTVDTSEPGSSGNDFNTVRGKFVDQSENTQEKSFPEVSSSTYVTEDGETIYTDLDFRTARTVYEAERNAIQALRLARENLTISGTLKFRCWKYQVYDVVTVTNSKIGISGAPMRILRMRLRSNFTIDVVLAEVASSDYSDPATGDYETPNAISTPTSASYAPNAPGDLTATGAANAIIFTWSPPAQAPVGVLYRLYEYSSSTPFSSATQVGSDTAQTSLVLPKSDTTVRYYWITAVDPVTGAESTQAPPSNGVPGAAASATSGLSALVNPSSATASGSSSSATTNSCAVTASGGTAPYTYLWTFTTGGASITITSSTSSSTTFSATGLSQGETRTGTARCRVTDNVGATTDVYVAVTISRTYTVDVQNQTVTAYGTASGGFGGGSPAVASVVFTPTGDVNGSDGTSYQWKDPGATASDYDIEFTVTSGTLSGGSSATGTKLQMTTGRTLIGVRTPGEGVGTSTQVVTVKMYLHASPFTLLDTATVTLNETLT
jgi:hypothetical protein